MSKNFNIQKTRERERDRGQCTKHHNNAKGIHSPKCDERPNEADYTRIRVGVPEKLPPDHP